MNLGEDTSAALHWHQAKLVLKSPCMPKDSCCMEAQQCQDVDSKSAIAAVYTSKTASQLQPSAAQALAKQSSGLSLGSICSSLTASSLCSKEAKQLSASGPQKRVAFLAGPNPVLAFPAGSTSSEADLEETAGADHEDELVSSQSCFQPRKVLCITAGNVERQQHRLEQTLKQEYDGHCYEVAVVAHAKALNYWASGGSTVDLVLLDNTRSSSDHTCEKTIAAIRCQWSTTQLPLVVIMPPLTHAAVISHMLAAGANDVLTAPVTASELRAHLAMQLALSRAEAAAAAADAEVELIGQEMPEAVQNLDLRPRRSTANWLLADGNTRSSKSSEHSCVLEVPASPNNPLYPGATTGTGFAARSKSFYGGPGRVSFGGLGVLGAGMLSGRCTADGSTCTAEEWLQPPLQSSAAAPPGGFPISSTSGFLLQRAPSTGGETAPAWYNSQSARLSRGLACGHDTVPTPPPRASRSGNMPTVSAGGFSQEATPAWVRNATSQGCVNPAPSGLPKPVLQPAQQVNVGRSVSLPKNQHRLARLADGEAGSPQSSPLSSPSTTPRPSYIP